MIFVDTSAFVARFIEKDQFHSIAMQYWTEIRDQDLRVYTSNYVLSETINLMVQWTPYEFALQVAELLYQSEVLEILRPDESIEIGAIDFLKMHAVRKIGFIDCVSFRLMQENDLSSAFTFDRHFEIAGFEMVPPSP